MKTEEELAAIHWDAIVIGTGMGGGTAGYELAKLGRRVLYLDKGYSNVLSARPLRGKFPAQGLDLAKLSNAEHDDFLARCGRSAEWFTDTTDRAKRKNFRPIIGSGTGGSSALYGMVAERFFRSDFTPRKNFKTTGKSTVPECWPISYDEMVPWYQRAEGLYRVRGTADPLRPEDDTVALRPPKPMTAGSSEIAGFLADRGLHPYNLHVACEYKDECQSCQNYLCPSGCKNYSGNICVEPAVQQHGAELLDRTTVTRLEASRTAVTHVVAERNGKALRFQGKVVVLAASALLTPVILLNSSSPEWPHGLANKHDVVGRNFMRHFYDLYLFRLREKGAMTGQVKEVSVNDFYHADDQKLGTVQSFGILPPFGFFMSANRADQAAPRFFSPVFERRWKSTVQDRHVALVSLMEDLPYADNRILPGPGSKGLGGTLLEMSYTMHEADINRHKEFTRRLKSSFGKYRNSRFFPVHLPGAKMNNNIAHQCGTCRFGDDPKTSVLDPNNRAWGLDNLYVVDASMLPSSSGINPSLTIAANALRVAHVIDSTL
jgi:choline dehydrogenase-like flavoprotein